MSTIESTAANQTYTPETGTSGNKSGGSDNFLSLLSIATGQITPDQDLGPQQSARPAEPKQQANDPAPKRERPAPAQNTAAEKPATPRDDKPKLPAREQETVKAEKPEAAPREEPIQRTEKTAEPKATSDNQPAKLKPIKETENKEPVSQTNGNQQLQDIKAEQARIREELDDQLEQIELILAALLEAFGLRHFTQAQAGGFSNTTVQYQSVTTTRLTQFSSSNLMQLNGMPNTEGVQQTGLAYFSSFTAVQYSFQSTTSFSAQSVTQSTQTGQTLSALRQLQASLQQLRAALNAASQSDANTQLTSPAASFTAKLTQTTITQVQTFTTTANTQQVDTAPTPDSLQAKLQALLAKLGASSQDKVQISATQDTVDADAPQLPADTKPQALSFGRLFDVLKEGLQQVRETIGQLQQQHQASGEKLQNLLPQTDTIIEDADQLEFVFKAQTISYSQRTQGNLPQFITSLGGLEDSLLGAGFGNPSQSAGQNAAQTLLGVLDGNSQQQTGSQTGGQSGNGQSGQQLLGALNSQSGQTNSASQSGENGFARTLARSTPALVNDQVQIHVKNAVKSGASNIHIQLDPEELGKLDIRLSVDANGKTGVTIIADNRQTLDLLQRDAAGLTRALNDAGLSTDSGSLNFNLRGGDQQQQQQGGNGKPSYYGTPQPEEEAQPLLINNTNPTDSYGDDSGLDIRI